MRPEARHAQGGIGGQNAQLGRQLGLDPVSAIQITRQFFRGFVPQGIADDDEGPSIIGFVKPWPYLPVEERVLVLDAIDRPPLG